MYFDKRKMIILLKHKILLSEGIDSLKCYVLTYFFSNSSFYPYNVFKFNTITSLTSLLKSHFK